MKFVRKNRSNKMTRWTLEDLFDLPRTFLAWILFHLASWMDMRVVPTNDSADDLMDQIWDELADVDIEDIEKDE
jgi:hypothetical protein